MNIAPDLVAPRGRSRKKTELALRLSLHRLKNQGEKISIAAVAAGADVSAALLHNRYPDIAEEVRALMGKSSREQRDSKGEDLVAERTKNRKLREQIAVLTAEVAKLASINESVRAELNLSKAMTDPKIVNIAAVRTR